MTLEELLDLLEGVKPAGNGRCCGPAFGTIPNGTITVG